MLWTELKQRLRKYPCFTTMSAFLTQGTDSLSPHTFGTVGSECRVVVGGVTGKGGTKNYRVTSWPFS